MSVRGISTPFGALFPTNRQVRTCSSAVRHSQPEGCAFDLHALGTPPALILSQDQTRQKMVKLLCWHKQSPLWFPVRERTWKRTMHTSVGKVRCERWRQKRESSDPEVVASTRARCQLFMSALECETVIADNVKNTADADRCQAPRIPSRKMLPKALWFTQLKMLLRNHAGRTIHDHS